MPKCFDLTQNVILQNDKECPYSQPHTTFNMIISWISIRYKYLKPMASESALAYQILKFCL